MSNLKYIELTSSYRNRNQWPEPAEFEIPISQSGRKGATDAVDPVCLATSFISWKIGQFNVVPNNVTINLSVENTLTNPIGNSTGTTVIYVKGTSLTDVLHSLPNYYCNAMLVNSVTSHKLRIFSYDYLGGNRAKIVVEGSFIPVLAPTTSLTISDPTDFTNIYSPYLYVPGPRLQQNVLVNKYVYNERLDEYRPLGVYDKDTNIVPIVTTTSVTSTRSGGPITLWTTTDNVSLRKEPPVSILSTSVVVPTRVELNQVTSLPLHLRNQIFNFTQTTPHSNIEGSFLQKLPYYSTTANLFQGVGTVTNQNTFDLAPSDSTIPGYPDGYWVDSEIRIVDSGLVNNVIGQQRKIKSYNGGIIEVDTAFSGDILLGIATYSLYTPPISRRIQKYVKYQASIPASSIPTTTTIEFPLVGSSDEEDFYKDLIITMTSGPASGEITRIKSYTIKNKTKTITVDPAFSVAPIIANTFSITSGKVDPFPFTLTIKDQTFVLLPFSYDNLNPFVYTGSLVSHQELVCYEVQLLNLILPNVVLGTGLGSLISFYPYLYVALQNVTAVGAGLNNIIYSNNPNSSRVLFRCPIKDVPNPVNSTFIKIDGSGMVQTIKFRPNDTLFFGVYLPNGEVFTTILNENTSPELPNPVIQVSGCFSIKRLS